MEDSAGASKPGTSKQKSKGNYSGGGSQAQGEGKSKAQLKAERRAKQEAQRAAKGKHPSGQTTSEELKPVKDVVKDATKDTASDSTKSKAELKAERRAKQEAQRLAKSQKQDTTTKTKGNVDAGRAEIRVLSSVQADNEKLQKRIAKKLAKENVPQRTSVQKKVGLFSHLHQYERQQTLTKEINFRSGSIHPAIIKLGLQHAEGIICGSNARCVSLLAALKQVIADYSTPLQKELSRDLEAKLKPNITFLTQCRPLSVSMGNAIKYLKLQITQTPPSMSEKQAKANLIEKVDKFIKEKIFLAGEAISKTYSIQKVHDGDVIMTYACSSLITKILKDAFHSGKKFRVIVVDSRPKNEGIHCLKQLLKHGIKCSYAQITSLAYLMKEVSKVFLGAHALLANGCVMSRVGSAMVSLVAKRSNVPVLVCCETYKFCDRVQTDAFVFNELGDPDDLIPDRNAVGSETLQNWRQLDSLNLLNLVYDVTPSDFVSMVITEIGMIPCTSVPVVLRVKNVEYQ
ncbi:translation initiation factor eIF-2B subunit delta-like [Dendronephthya gigantea]|uniref:translation initiation factor eIF-2B subunit delta-like n=1 Tax=Dendronephthya gigantea TaxID=151771 RepID=UPI00106CBEE6|nr:translation initiation factor eIF-2B subunit delta-like [Dendronephthya gigantea]